MQLCSYHGFIVIVRVHFHFFFFHNQLLPLVCNWTGNLAYKLAFAWWAYALGQLVNIIFFLFVVIIMQLTGWRESPLRTDSSPLVQFYY